MEKKWRKNKMGLDQYLIVKKYLSDYNEEEKKDKVKLKKIFKDIEFEPNQVSFNVYYWRKSNAIHIWFVNNVQEGNDDCKEHYVEWEKLEELLKIINKILGCDAKRLEKEEDYYATHKESWK